MLGSYGLSRLGSYALLAAIYATARLDEDSQPSDVASDCFLVADGSSWKGGPRVCVDPSLSTRSNDGWFACECINATQILRIAPPVSVEAQTLPSFVVLIASKIPPGITATFSVRRDEVPTFGIWNQPRTQVWPMNHTPKLLFEVNETGTASLANESHVEFAGGYATCLTTDIRGTVFPMYSNFKVQKGRLSLQIIFQPPAQIGSTILCKSALPTSIHSDAALNMFAFSP
jgi:hypothetical protein